MSSTPANPRRLRGFEPASLLVRDPVRKVGEARGFALVRLLTHWAEVAGAELGQITRPVDISYGREGMGATLTLLVSGAAGPIVQMQLPALRERVNACYGYNAVVRIRLTQTTGRGLAEGQAPFTREGAPQRAGETAHETAPDPQILAEAAALSREVRDERLRAALEALGQKVLSRARHRKG